MKNGIQTAVYYFPNYHVDPRNEKIHGTGWTEWELMKHATPRFPGHDQPKVPLWGYEDESDPAVMAKKIEAAADHGIDAFVFDWYWYEEPYLERALSEGFLKAKNNRKLKFALMWANHDWKNFHPGSRNTSSYPIDFPWSTTRDTVGFVWDYIIERFMTHPQYWRVDGLPYFSIYAFNRFITQMDGVEATAEVIELLRKKARAAGLPGVHVNGIWFDILDTNPACSACPQSEWVTRIKLNSYTSYNSAYVGKIWLSGLLNVDYKKSAEEYVKIAKKAMSSLPAPYYPVITTGWDSSPRTIQSEIYDNKLGYPYLSVMEPTPEKFAYTVNLTLECLKDRPKQEKIMFINAWNEWTEGSYLEPDKKYGFGYLEALKTILGKQ
ncbi:MAG: glycoside hydrolase family 99-like domain-containing protein [Lentisphaerae bacterium]|nr:glycoside hydrolase family 99-like domain-containing protein [Lentisphaerota bacterium]